MNEPVSLSWAGCAFPLPVAPSQAWGQGRGAPAGRGIGWVSGFQGEWACLFQEALQVFKKLLHLLGGPWKPIFSLSVSGSLKYTPCHLEAPPHPAPGGLLYPSQEFRIKAGTQVPWPHLILFLSLRGVGWLI